MSFEFEKKFIIATLLFVLILFSSVVIFYFSQRGKDQKPLFEFAEELNGQEKPADQKDRSKEQTNEEAKTTNILFGGDMNFDRYIRAVVETKGIDFVLENIKPEMNRADFMVANLEGPITGNASVSAESEIGARENYIFTFPRETANHLAEYNISVVNIGNNHILNFGNDGLEQTRVALKEAGVKYFGDPQDEDYRWYVKESNGNRIGFVCYNQFTDLAEQKTINDLALAKEKAGAIIVYTHWGIEYETKANENQKELARKFIDHGADLVIGSHPHVVQEMEEYQGKRIYYSLGNFIFDQYFEENTQKGLLVLVSVSGEKVSGFEETDIVMERNGQVNLLQN